MHNTQLLAEQAAQYRALAERGDLRELSRVVMRAACHNGSMTGVGSEGMKLLRALPDDQRHELAGIWARWYAHVEGDWTAEEFRRDLGYLRAELLLVASGVVRDLDGDLLAAERQEQLAALSSQYVIWSSHRIWELADAELAAGRVPQPAILAAFRRTAAATTLPGLRRTAAAANGREPGLRDLLTRFPGPVLNPGEPWADQALQEAAIGGEPWQRLLAHAAPATAGAPSATWERSALALLEAAGPEAVRRGVLRWFGLAGLDRTVPLLSHPHLSYDVNRCHDPYNTHVLRGLAWSLSLLPPHPDTVPALVGLVEAALDNRSGHLRSPQVAEAGIVALTRIGGQAARAELETLSRQVEHQGISRRIDKALAAQ
ncbi:hypothetical protein GCM10011579_065510 [Streptomyces albiflavescens]|uniref:Uncharacterized protein n=2 Tax=Streptomyces albiflavescens TaxID=1623582 RepID=A0A918D7K9_9ACTN|nr:hypothetical protein GCM10011579_065510 [Streptomyces albiflavescens]